MPAILANASGFMLNSDFPLDKVIITNTTSIVQAGFSASTTTIAHGLPFIPLMMGSYSNLSDYSILYSLNAGPIAANPITASSPFDYIFNIKADATNVTFSTENHTASSVTFYIRYYGFEPSTSNVDLSATAALADVFQFNSDQNYTKLYLNGYVDQAAVGGSPVTQTVAHGLGHTTQANTWKEVAGVITPITFQDGGDLQIEDVVTSIDSNNINFNFVAFAPAMKVHYRLYLDV